MKMIIQHKVSEAPSFSIQLPAGAEILSCASLPMRDGRRNTIPYEREIWIFALVDNSQPREERHFYHVRAGERLPEDLGAFIGTLVLPGEHSTHVLHLYERKKKA